MVRIRVEYDAYNRTFKLVDREFGSILEDGAVYELLATPEILCDVAISPQSKAGKDTVALISIETLISRQRSVSAARAASA